MTSKKDLKQWRVKKIERFSKLKFLNMLKSWFWENLSRDRDVEEQACLIDWKSWWSWTKNLKDSSIILQLLLLNKLKINSFMAKLTNNRLDNTIFINLLLNRTSSLINLINSNNINNRILSINNKEALEEFSKISRKTLPTF